MYSGLCGAYGIIGGGDPEGVPGSLELCGRYSGLGGAYGGLCGAYGGLCGAYGGLCGMYSGLCGAYGIIGGGAPSGVLGPSGLCDA